MKLKNKDELILQIVIKIFKTSIFLILHIIYFELLNLFIWQMLNKLKKGSIIILWIFEYKVTRRQTNWPRQGWWRNPFDHIVIPFTFKDEKVKRYLEKEYLAIDGRFVTEMKSGTKVGHDIISAWIKLANRNCANGIIMHVSVRCYIRLYFATFFSAVFF